MERSGKDFRRVAPSRNGLIKTLWQLTTPFYLASHWRQRALDLHHQHLSEVTANVQLPTDTTFRVIELLERVTGPNAHATRLFAGPDSYPNVTENARASLEYLQILVDRERASHRG